MKKTLAIILNHNTPQLTDSLYEELKPYEREDYDLFVLDNGSCDVGKSKYTNRQLKKNMFFGGGLNLAFNWFKNQNDKYDSLIFLNSDIVVYGKSYIRTLREALLEHDLAIVSPCIVGNWVGKAPLNMHNHMNCWGSRKVRLVKYVDFQTPMFHEKFVLEVGEFPKDLMFGIGQDHISGILCEKMSWKIGVIDWCVAYHEWAATIRSGNGPMRLDSFAQVSNEALSTYAKKCNLVEKIEESFKWGAEYEFKPKN